MKIILTIFIYSLITKWLINTLC
jgi:hypothetical protein